MNVAVPELEAIANEVEYDLGNKDYYAFLHKTQEAGFFKDYPKPNARRKRVPYQKPEVGVNGVIGPYQFELEDKGVGFYEVLTKRGYKYTVKKDQTRDLLKEELEKLRLLRISILTKLEEKEVAK